MQSAPRSDWSAAVAAILALTAWRLAVLFFDGTDLRTDEAQYWVWGKALDWGYYSKPPMIAWLQAAVTGIAGSDAMAVIRAPLPVLNAVTGIVLGLVAQRLYDSRTGALTALLFVSMPIVTMGSWILGTDAVMLPFYALALYAYVRLTEGRSAGWAAALGIAAGLGMLSKYAMIYLALVVPIAAALVPRARIAWRDAGLASVVALAVLSPNLVWNVLNGASTLQHTALDNARVGQARPDLVRGIEWLLSQVVAFSPVAFWLLFRGTAAGWRDARTRWLAALSIPIIVVVAVAAIRAIAHANWAVPAYLPGTILVAALMARDRPRLRRATLGFNIAVAVLVPVLFMLPHALRSTDGSPLIDRYLGRTEFALEIAALADREGLATIVSPDRAVLATLDWVLRDRSDIAVRGLFLGGRPRNYWEQTRPYTGEGPALLLTRDPNSCGSAKAVATLAPDSGYFSKYRFEAMRLEAPCRGGE